MSADYDAGDPYALDPRPCSGRNSNICVAEGCYGQVCLTLPHPDLAPDAGTRHIVAAINALTRQVARLAEGGDS